MIIIFTKLMFNICREASLIQIDGFNQCLDSFSLWSKIYPCGIFEYLNIYLLLRYYTKFKWLHVKKYRYRYNQNHENLHCHIKLCKYRYQCSKSYSHRKTCTSNTVICDHLLIFHFQHKLTLFRDIWNIINEYSDVEHINVWSCRLDLRISYENFLKFYNNDPSSTKLIKRELFTMFLRNGWKLLEKVKYTRELICYQSLSENQCNSLKVHENVH